MIEIYVECPMCRERMAYDPLLDELVCDCGYSSQVDPKLMEALEELLEFFEQEG
jgi:hypothetical protein